MLLISGLVVARNLDSEQSTDRATVDSGLAGDTVTKK